MEINGIAHVMLTTNDFPRARRFYGQLLPFLGLTPLVDDERMTPSGHQVTTRSSSKIPTASA